MLEEDMAYIRPCAAFPDGLLFEPRFIPRLQELGLIGESAEGWAENATELDFYPIYDDFHMDNVVDDIMRIVG